MGRTYCDWQHQKSGGLPFNKPSPPQTQAGLLVMSAGQTVLHFSLLVSVAFLAAFLLTSPSLIPLPGLAKHTWKQSG